MYFPDSMTTSYIVDEVRELEEEICTCEQKIILEKDRLRRFRKEIRPKRRLLAKMRFQDARRRAKVNR